jgi:hypothetical protein
MTRRGWTRKRASGGFQSPQQCSVCREMPVHSEQDDCFFCDGHADVVLYPCGKHRRPCARSRTMIFPRLSNRSSKSPRYFSNFPTEARTGVGDPAARLTSFLTKPDQLPSGGGRRGEQTPKVHAAKSNSWLFRLPLRIRPAVSQLPARKAKVPVRHTSCEFHPSP